MNWNEINCHGTASQVVDGISGPWQLDGGANSCVPGCLRQTKPGVLAGLWSKKKIGAKTGASWIELNAVCPVCAASCGLGYEPDGRVTEWIGPAPGLWPPQPPASSAPQAPAGIFGAALRPAPWASGAAASAQQQAEASGFFSGGFFGAAEPLAPAHAADAAPALAQAAAEEAAYNTEHLELTVRNCVAEITDLQARVQVLEGIVQGLQSDTQKRVQVLEEIVQGLLPPEVGKGTNATPRDGKGGAGATQGPPTAGNDHGKGGPEAWQGDHSEQHGGQKGTNATPGDGKGGATTQQELPLTLNGKSTNYKGEKGATQGPPTASNDHGKGGPEAWQWDHGEQHGGQSGWWQ